MLTELVINLMLNVLQTASGWCTRVGALAQSLGIDGMHHTSTFGDHCATPCHCCRLEGA